MDDFCKKYPQLCENRFNVQPVDFGLNKTGAVQPPSEPIEPGTSVPPSRDIPGAVQPPKEKQPLPDVRPGRARPKQRAFPKEEPVFVSDEKTGNPVAKQDDKQTKVLIPLVAEKATIDTLPEDVKTKAKLVEASKAMWKHHRGVQEAKNILRNTGYKIDVELSNPRDGGLVVVRNGKAEIIYRGTDTSHALDIAKDVDIFLGREKFHIAEEQFNRVSERYGQPESVSGFSLGGNMAMNIANKYKIKSTTFNPAVGRKLVFTPNEGDHSIYRTTEDGVSIASRLGEIAHGWKVEHILPLKDSLNPVEAHRLANFSQTGERRPDMIEDIQENIVDATNRFSEADLVLSMKNAQERGLTLTEWIVDFNSGSGIDTEGGLSNRINSGSKIVQVWSETGTLTPNEQAHIENVVGTKQQLSLSPSEREVVRVRGQIEVDDYNKSFQDLHDEYYRATENHTRAIASLSNTTRSETLRQIHPTTIAKGVGAGIVAREAVDRLGGEERFGEYGSEALTGATTGVLLEPGALASASASAPVVVGMSAGAVVSHKVEKEIRREQQLKDTRSERVKAVERGAGAGAVFGATAGLAGLAMGAEIGAVGGPVGVLVGGAIGAGIGAIFGH